jgi:hypothetical protein
VTASVELELDRKLWASSTQLGPTATVKHRDRRAFGFA